MQVSSQPYLKTFTFPLFSVAALLKLILIVITVALPFFVTYSTPNFYLTSHLATAPTQQITPLPKYHIEITTSKSTYIYTNLYTYPSSRAIAIEQLDSNGVLTFRTKWSRSDTTQRVVKAQLTLFFNFVASGTTQFGIASGSVSGYNIAEASIAGVLKVERGSGIGAITENNLTLNGYNFLQTQFQSSQSLNYLAYQYSSLPINLPSDMTTITMTVNYGSIYATQETPSILGQLVWSWIQYFPILLSIYWLLDRAFCYLLRQRVVRCGIVHDREYLALIEQQNARRERLRQA